MVAAADPTAMAIRMEDTRATRETATRAGERTAAGAAGTAEERTAAMTAGDIPSSGRSFARLHPDATYFFVLLYFFFLKKKFCKKILGYLL